MILSTTVTIQSTLWIKVELLSSRLCTEYEMMAAPTIMIKDTNRDTISIMLKFVSTETDDTFELKAAKPKMLLNEI